MSGSNNQDGDDIFGNVYQNLRRFRDQHISAMLHSLIGLPSILATPPTSAWVIIDEDLAASRTPQTLAGPPDGDWKKARAYSEGDPRLGGKTMQETTGLNANWVAQRTGAGSGVEGSQTGGDGNTRTIFPQLSTSTSSSTGSQGPSPSSGVADPTSPRSVYVFRFLLPPSPLFRDGSISDPPSALDVCQHPYNYPNHQYTFNQAMNYHDPFFPHPFFSSEITPSPQFHFQHQHHPFFPLFGFPHSFMFNPLWSLMLLTPPPPFPHNNNYNPQDRQSYYQQRSLWKDDQFLNPFRLFDDALRSVWEDQRRYTEKEFPRQQRRTVYGDDEEKKDDAPPQLTSPSAEEGFTQSAETEQDAYEFLDSLTKEDEKTPTSYQNSNNELTPSTSPEEAATKSSRRVIGTSTIMKSHTLPDGSTFTKTIKIRRFDDGTEQRIENEHSTPPYDKSRLTYGAGGEEKNEFQVVNRRWGFGDGAEEEDEEGWGEVEDLWDLLMGRHRRGRGKPTSQQQSGIVEEEDGGHKKEGGGGGILEKLKTLGKREHKDRDIEQQGTVEKSASQIISKE